MCVACFVSFAQKISRCSTFWLKKYPAVAGYSAKRELFMAPKRPPYFFPKRIFVDGLFMTRHRQMMDLLRVIIMYPGNKVARILIT
jgi:hypothetical protein